MADDPPPPGVTVADPPPPGVTVAPSGGGGMPRSDLPPFNPPKPTPSPEHQSLLERMKQQVLPWAMPGAMNVEVGRGEITGLGQLGIGAGQWAEKAGVPVSRYVPGAVSRGYEAQRQQSEANIPGQVGERLGRAAPFLAMPAMRGAPYLWRMLAQSTGPGLLDPVDPTQDFTRQKVEQGIASTLTGEALRGAGSVGERFLKSQYAQDALDALQKAYQQFRGVPGRLEEQFQRLKGASQQAQNVEDVRASAANQTGRQAIDLLNQGNKAWYDRLAEQAKLSQGAHKAATETEQALATAENERLARVAETTAQGSRMGAEMARTKQEAIPEEETRNIYRTIGRLAGIGVPREFTWQTAAGVRDAVGQKLNPLYEQMTIDARGPRMVFPAFRQEVEDALTGFTDPTVKATWNDLYQRIAFNPLNKAGLLEGKTLAQYTSSMRNVINDLGLKAQNGDPSARIMANGLRQMLHVVNQEAARFNPQLSEQLGRINMGYELASRMQDSAKVGNRWMPPPGEFLNSFEQAQGPSLFGLDQRWMELKNRLDAADKAHQSRIPKPIPAVPQTVEPRDVPWSPLRTPEPPPKQELPIEVKARQVPQPQPTPASKPLPGRRELVQEPTPRRPGVPTTATLAHGVGHVLGGPALGTGARVAAELASHGRPTGKVITTRGPVPRWLARQAERASRLQSPAAAAAAQAATEMDRRRRRYTPP